MSVYVMHKPSLTSNPGRQRTLIYAVLVILLSGCSGGTSETLQAGSPIPIATETNTPQATVTTTPDVTPGASHQGGLLSIISPLEDPELRGGTGLSFEFYLVDHDGLPVEGAEVQVALKHPSSKNNTDLLCVEKGEGRYLCEEVNLPLRGGSGTWQVIGEATWEDGQQAKAERNFRVNPSVSEMYQNRYGFWIEHPRIFGVGTGFYNLRESGGLHFEDWLEKDGSGYVILDNYRYDALGVTFATLEVHWQYLDFPDEGEAVMAYAEKLASSGLHHQDPETPITKVTAKKVTFQDRPAWQVLGRGSEFYVAKAAADYPIEWLIFRCPGEDKLWSLVIASDNAGYMNQLRSVQETFECPPVDPN